MVVDNASTDSSGEYIREHYTSVDCVRIEPNRGFAGGNNFGYDHVRRHYPEARYLVLLNVDTVVEPGWLRPLVQVMEDNPRCGAAQSLLVLHADGDRINTTGNHSHYLGFGMMSDYGKPRDASSQTTCALDFPSALR